MTNGKQLELRKEFSMRGTFVLAGIVAGLLLAACSSNGSPSLPGASRAVTSDAHSPLHFALVGVKPDKSCPSGYLACETISRTKHARLTICVDSSSACPAPGNWTWAESIETLAGKPVHKIVGDISPNPGNPITDKISEKKRERPSKGAVKFQQLVEACDSSSNCLQATIGIITK